MPEGEVGVAGWGAYIPRRRMSRSLAAAAWGGTAAPGERAVAGADEDSLTMAVAAAQNALGGDTNGVDAVFFASTSSPYQEKQAAATIAKVLDLPESAATTDVTGSLRAGTDALRLGLDAVRAGSATKALVVAADMRVGEPATPWEQLVGDAAAAVVIGRGDLAATVVAESHRYKEFLGPWRRQDDPYVQSFEGKVEGKLGYEEQLAAAVLDTVETAGIEPGQVNRLAVSAPDRGALRNLGRRLNVPDGMLDFMLLDTVGSAGAAHPLLSLCHALEEGAPGEVAVVAGYGEGADAFVLRATDRVPGRRPRAAVAELIEAGEPLRSYEELLEARNLIKLDLPEPRVSAVQYHRDVEMELPLKGGRCQVCTTVQFPAWRICRNCGAEDSYDMVPLARAGTVFTFVLDHLDRGRYLERPVARLVVDLDGGGRIFLEMSEGDPYAVAVGSRVELTFRRMHGPHGYGNYYWKAEPPRLNGAAQGS
jgi:hydroxymethylglutaryl-CoA synthase